MNFENKNIFYTTSTVLEWQNVLLYDGVPEIIYDTWKYLSEHKRIKLLGFVIMPNHIHWMYDVLEPYKNEQIKHSFLSFSANLILELLGEDRAYFYVGNSKRKYQLWKSPSLSVPIFTDDFYFQKLNYIHQNPLRAMLVENAAYYLHSSKKSYLQNNPEWDFLDLGY